MPGRVQPRQADSPDVNEWNGTRFAGMSRTGGNNEFFPQHPLGSVRGKPISPGMVYLNVKWYTSRPSIVRRLWSGVTWPYRNWELKFNFRNQDYDAEKYVQYASPEYPSATDSVVVAMRRLFVEHARDVQRRREREEELHEAPEETEADRMVREVDAQVAAASQTFDADHLEEELLRRVQSQNLART